MRRLNVFVLLFLGIFMAVGLNAYASTPEELIWWEFKTVQEDTTDESDQGGMAAFLNKKKKLVLHKGNFLLPEAVQAIPASSLTEGETDVWIRNPDGVVTAANLQTETDAIALNLPSDLNPGNLSGRYLVAAHMDAGIMDIDSDGKDEKVHLYSKYLVNYSQQDGTEGNRPDTFFRDGDKLPLEVGPALTNSIFKSAGCPHKNVLKGKATVTSYVSDGGTQRPLRDYQINVLFKGEPLANAEVLVLSQSGWRKTVMTDAEGSLSFTPPNTLERSSDSEKTGRSHGMSRSGKANGEDKSGTADSDKQTASRQGMHPGAHGMATSEATHPGAHGMATSEATHPGAHGMSTSEAQNESGKDVAKKSNGMPDHVRRKLQAAGDKLIYMVAYNDPSTGEYHCATLPITLKESFITNADISGKASGFTLWGIMGAGLCCIGFGGSVYHRKKRNRGTILKSKKE